MTGGGPFGKRLKLPGGPTRNSGLGALKALGTLGSALGAMVVS